jgi:hypothetical protein
MKKGVELSLARSLTPVRDHKREEISVRFLERQVRLLNEKIQGVFGKQI